MPRLLPLLLCLIAAPAWAQTAEIELARQHLTAHAKHFEVPEGSAPEARVTSSYTSTGNGITHVYFRQTLGGIDVRGGDVTVNLRQDGSVLHAAGRFVPDVEAARGSAPAIAPEAAVAALISYVGLDVEAPPAVIEQSGGAEAFTRLTEAGVARAPIEARLIFEPTAQGLRLAWEVILDESERPHVWAARIDAETGAVLVVDDLVVHDHWGPGHDDDHSHHLLAEAFDAHASGAERQGLAGWHPPLALDAGISTAGVSAAGATAAAFGARGAALLGGTYRVYDYPLESPSHGERTLVTNPADPVASPLGWHATSLSDTYTITRGNNVFAYADANATNSPSGTDAIPEGGLGLHFDFPVDLTQDPVTYRLAAVTNLFYWNNLVHDVLYRYGFDEVAGNFQTVNFSGQGFGNDAVRAEAQDGGGTNNANFMTPADGSPPRMQMYLWNQTTPRRDGDFDNGIIAHEYAHGWSIRLTGGPNNVQCLSTQTYREQMGEGWSDYLSLILSMRPGDTAEQRRGIGTYVLGQPVTGRGIRPAPYSRAFAENDFTYGRLPQMAVPHGVGFVWATMLWDMTWDLVDLHGFDPDLSNYDSGNAIAFRLVSEAMKLQPCGPGFVDGRDAIIAADEALYDGAHVPLIWSAFARRGLGYSADQGSPTSATDGTEAFDLPPGMGREFALELGDPVTSGEFLPVTLRLENGSAMNALSGVAMTTTLPEGLRYAPGSLPGAVYDEATGTLTLPPVDVDSGEESVRRFYTLVTTEGGSTVLFRDRMNMGAGRWQVGAGTGSALWSLQSGQGTANTGAWYARSATTTSDQLLILAQPVTPLPGTVLSFRHRYHTEPEWDGGVVEISVDGGAWQDLGSRMTQNGYDVNLRNSSNPLAGRPAFTGNSGFAASSQGWVTTEVDLSDFAGEPVRVRFRFGTDNSTGYPNYPGWYVDEVLFLDEVAVTAQACAVADIPLGCSTVRSLVMEPLAGAPVLVLDDAPLAYTAEFDGAIEVALPIENAGGRHLRAFAGSDAAWFVAAASPVRIAPGVTGAVTFTLDAAGLDPGVYETEVVLLSNDPAEPEVILPLSFAVGSVSTDPVADRLEGGFALSSAYPNPFRQRAEFSLEVAKAQRVTVAVYDVMGREVARLHDDELLPGRVHRFAVAAEGLASGVYLLGVRGEDFATTQRVTVVR